MNSRESILTVAVFALVSGMCFAQSEAPAPQSGNQQDTSREPRRRPDVMGKITAINGQTLTIQNSEGHDVTIKVSDSTRFMKDRKQAKLADFKVGDWTMVRGRSTGTDTWDAEFLGSRSASADGGGPGGFSQAGFAQEWGKKFIAGEIKAIDGTHLTIAGPDGQTLVIAVDENTSFRRDNESIALADFKVGDHIFGPGEVQAGTFVPSRLILGNMHRMHGDPEGNQGPAQK